MSTLPDATTLDHETAHDDDAPTWSDLDEPARVHLPVLRPRVYPDGSRVPRSGARAKTISLNRLSKRELERGRMMYPEAPAPRPKTRAGCLHGEHTARPCPFVSCKHHLYLDVSEDTGSIKLNFPDLEVWELPETCALDIADRGGMTLEEVGELMNLTRERVRQLEHRGLTELRRLGEKLRDFVDYEVPDSEGDDHDLRATPARDTVRDTLDPSALARLPTGVWSCGEERS